jgi:hypothetical protein
MKGKSSWLWLLPGVSHDSLKNKIKSRRLETEALEPSFSDFRLFVVQVPSGGG